MIDTIEFYIHDLEAHQKLADFLHRASIGEGLSQVNKGVEAERDLPSVKIKDYTYFHESGNTVERSYWNKIPSYNYEISYKIDQLKGRIEMNLSIPKYLYRTNLFMFLPTYDSGQYYGMINSKVKDQLNGIYPYFKKFFKFFFDKEFVNIPIDNRYLEIVRLDLCYNFIFRSEEEAKTYLTYLKRSRKKFQRKDGKATQYESSIYFPQKNVTFKIYHKLPEFLKHDLKEFKKHSEQTGKSIKGIKEMKELAGRTIRYEMEFRKPFLNDVFKKRMFRKNDSLWKEGLEIWKSRDDKQTVKFKGQRVPILKLPAKQKKLLRYVNAIMNKRFTYYHDLFYSVDATNWAKSSLDYIDEIKNGEARNYSFYVEQKFTAELFGHLVDRFFKELKHFHVTYINDIYDVLQKVKAEKLEENQVAKFYSEMNKVTGKVAQPLTGISINKLNQVLQLLQKYSYDEIRKENLIPQRTLERYRSLLKQFGINDSVSYGREIKKENNLSLYDIFIKDNLVLTYYLLSLPYELRQ